MRLALSFPIAVHFHVSSSLLFVVAFFSYRESVSLFFGARLIRIILFVCRQLCILLFCEGMSVRVLLLLSLFFFFFSDFVPFDSEQPTENRHTTHSKEAESMLNTTIYFEWAYAFTRLTHIHALTGNKMPVDSNGSKNKRESEKRKKAPPKS